MRVAPAVRLTGSERKRIEQLVKLGHYRNVSSFLRDAVRCKLKELDLVALVEGQPGKINKAALDALLSKPDVYADDVAVALGIDIETAIKTITRLYPGRESSCVIGHGVHDGIEGERVVCVCRGIKRQRVVAGSGAQRTVELVIEGAPVKCFVLKRFQTSQQ